jgi:hypothetical protein
VATIVSFDLTYGLSGVSSEAIASFANTNALIATVKTCLSVDVSNTKGLNVTISSASPRRLDQKSLRKNIRVLDASVVFSIKFNVDEQNYLDAADGYSKMTAQFQTNAASGVFTTTLRANAVKGGELSTATGATSVTATSPVVTFIQLMYPSMLPTISVRPSVVPTVTPTTLRPTLLPTTFAPTQLPTTPRPTFMPTMKTSKFEYLTDFLK